MRLAGRQLSQMSVRRKVMKGTVKKIGTSVFALFYATCFAPMGQAYSFDMIVPDIRQPAAISGGSACPVRTHQLTAAGSIAVRWSTALNTSPVTIVTQNQTASGRLTEIEQVIAQALAVWTGVSGTTLVPATLAPLPRTATQNACGPDGVNSICFDQADMAFTPGVLAFTRVITTDRLGVQVGSSAVATQLGQILDADIYFNPSDSNTAYATPQALAANPKAYDFESLLTHELGHFLGFSHSAVWSAIMFPYAPAPGTFSGMRPTSAQPDAPLGDDDRTGLRVLYPDPADAVHRGSISGQIFPANPLALPASPPGVTGVFGSQVVAVDAANGAVVGATLGGWSCTAPGPAQFDGTYEIDGLAVGHSYTVYAEALNGAVDPSQVYNAIVSLCRNTVSDPGWPPLQGCVVPAVETSFTARTRPGP
jgi:Matrixin